MTEKFTLGENTPIKIGFVILIVGLLGSAIWWASDVTSTLRAIMIANSEIARNDVDQSKEISDIKTRLSLIENGGTIFLQNMNNKMIEFEKVGSPALVPRILAVESRLVELKLELDKQKNKP